MQSMIKRITDNWVENGIITKSDDDIYEYGLELLLCTIINITVILISAAFIGKIYDSIAMLAIIIPLQSCGGGYHAKTHLRCFLIMYIGWWGVIFLLPYITSPAAIITISLSVLVIFTLAPVPHINVSMSNEQRKKMRRLTRAITFVAALLSIFLTLIISERVGTAIATGIGVCAFSMLAANLKNMWTRERA